MAKYHTVMRQIALRCNALTGPLAASLETNYADATLVAGDFKSTSFPFTSMKDSLRVTEGEIALAVANNKDHPWSSIITDETAALATGANIPAVSGTGLPIIGVYRGAVDGSDGKPLGEDFTVDEIRRLNENPGTWRKIVPYQFAIEPPEIHHTQTTAKVKVCVWDPDDCDTDIAANADLLFPGAEGAYVAGLGSKMHNLSGEFAALAQTFVPEYAAWLSAISAGKTKP